MIEKVWNPDSIRDRLQMRAIQRRRPLSCTLELTYRCNFRCKMCYVRLDPCQMAPLGRERTAAEWLDMAAQARDAGLTFLLILAVVVVFIPWASDDWDSLPALLAIMGGFMLFFLLLQSLGLVKL